PLLRFLGAAGQERGEAVALEAHAPGAVVDGSSGRRAGERAAGRPRREQHQGDAVRPRAEREAADSRVHGDDGNVPGREVPQQRAVARGGARCAAVGEGDRKSTRLNSSHEWISYAVFCLKKKTSRTTFTRS